MGKNSLYKKYAVISTLKGKAGHKRPIWNIQMALGFSDGK